MLLGRRRRHDAARQQQPLPGNTSRLVQSVLAHSFIFGRRRLTIREASGPAYLDAATGQPPYAAITALQAALDRHYLTLPQKRKLFETLGWKFECLACHKIKPPADFEGTSYIFWGPDAPRRPGFAVVLA